jgi:sulfur transfer complex TusBCD TusB component (DsrH family)
MFHSARDLVEENDRRLELIADDKVVELTAEYVSFIAD